MVAGQRAATRGFMPNAHGLSAAEPRRPFYPSLLPENAVLFARSLVLAQKPGVMRGCPDCLRYRLNPRPERRTPDPRIRGTPTPCQTAAARKANGIPLEFVPGCRVLSNPLDEKCRSRRIRIGIDRTSSSRFAGWLFPMPGWRRGCAGAGEAPILAQARRQKSGRNEGACSDRINLLKSNRRLETTASNGKFMLA